MKQPNATASLRRLAEMLLLCGEHDAAHAVLQELAALDPLSAAKGEATRAMLQGHRGQALLLARRTADRHPDDLEASVLAAHTLAAVGRLAEGRARLTDAAARHPQSVLAWLNLIDVTTQLGDMPAAFQHIQTGLRACPDSPALWLALARWHVKSDEAQAAMEAYRQGLMRDPASRDLWLESAEVLLETTTADAAAQWLEVAVQEPLAQDVDVHAACARAWAAAGDPDRAAAALERLRDVSAATSRSDD